MKRMRSLTSHPFLFALLLLLANDLFLKEAFHNLWTGKISDFAGVFVFPIFWAVLFPRYKKAIILLTAAGFVFWKSPYSQELIEGWNRSLLFDVGRVVDMSDLLALSVLPFTYFHERITKWFGRVRLSPAIPLLISAFAFMATSYRSEVEHREDYSFPYSSDSLMKRVHREAVSVRSTRMWERRPGDSAEYVYVSRIDGDTMISDIYRPMEKELGDTMEISLQDSVLGYFSAYVLIEEKPQGSLLRSYRFSFSAPNKDEHAKRLPGVFEERLIDELRKDTSSSDEKPSH